MRNAYFLLALAASAALAQAPVQPLPAARRTVQTTDGKSIEGQVIGEGMSDLQLRSGDGRITLLRKEGGAFRVVTSQADWPTYNGDPSGNRYSKLTAIDKSNVARLGAKWIFPIPTARQIENTPLVVEGIMYVSMANECWALDAGTGRMLWRYQRARTQGLAGNASVGFNRGVAWAGDRIFMLTDNAHMLALNRFNGELLWETEMADWHQNYNGTSAPLTVGNLVISGTAGGDEGVRGFVGGLRSIHGPRGVALLDGAEAGRARLGNMERERCRAPLRRNLDDRNLRCPAQYRLLAGGQSGPGLHGR